MLGLMLVLAACDRQEPPVLQALPEVSSGAGAAAQRTNGPIGSANDLGVAQVSVGTVRAAPALPAEAGDAGGDISLDFVDTDVREIAAQVLGTILHVNYTIDPAVHGTATLRTVNPISRARVLPTLAGRAGAERRHHRGGGRALPRDSGRQRRLARPRRRRHRRQRGRAAALRFGRGPRQAAAALCRRDRKGRGRRRAQRAADQRRPRHPRRAHHPRARVRHRRAGRTVLRAVPGHVRKRQGLRHRAHRSDAQRPGRGAGRRGAGGADGADQLGAARLRPAPLHRRRAPGLWPGGARPAPDRARLARVLLAEQPQQRHRLRAAASLHPQPGDRRAERARRRHRPAPAIQPERLQQRQRQRHRRRPGWRDRRRDRRRHWRRHRQRPRRERPALRLQPVGRQQRARRRRRRGAGPARLAEPGQPPARRPRARRRRWGQPGGGHQLDPDHPQPGEQRGADLRDARGARHHRGDAAQDRHPAAPSADRRGDRRSDADRRPRATAPSSSSRAAASTAR